MHSVSRAYLIIARAVCIVVEHSWQKAYGTRSNRNTYDIPVVYLTLRTRTVFAALMLLFLVIVLQVPCLNAYEGSAYLILSYGTVQHSTDYCLHTAFVSYEHGFLWPVQVEEDINRFSGMVGKGLYAYSIGSTICWGEDLWMLDGQLSYRPLLESGLIKAIQIIIWPSTNDTYDNWTVVEIANGEYDNYIAEIAKQIKNFTYPVFLRFGAEMNICQGPEYWAGAYSFGENPAAFVAAWRRVVDLFRAEGASNAVFVWNPNWQDEGFPHHYTEYYPGDEYVDWVGIDMYQETPTMDPEAQMASIYNTYSTVKRIMIAEWGVNWAGQNFSDADRSSYMTSFFDAIEKRPDIKCINYWYIDLENQYDFTFTPSTLPLTTSVYVNRISNARYADSAPEGST